MTPIDTFQTILVVGQTAVIALLIHDLFGLRARVDEIEVEDSWLEKEDKKLESQDDQLRAELDDLRRAVDFLRRSQRPRADQLQTLEGAFAPPSWDPQATQVRSPNTPRLPSFCLPMPPWLIDDE